jgi:enamine deaminase RidA (YjgF/YER057c/UK114 family)
LQIRERPRQGLREVFVTCAGSGLGSLGSVARYLRETLAAHTTTAEYFGPRLQPAGQASARSLLARAGFPFTWVQGGTLNSGLGGLHLRAVAGPEVKPLVLDGQVVGALVAGPYAEECLLGGIYPPDPTAPAPAQARATFERLEQALALAGMDFSHVARTWFFLDDILSWYDAFNQERTAFLTERGVGESLLPASTGVGGSNPAGAALVARAYAVKALQPGVTVEAVPSPLQCPAPEYGSSFSRAVEVVMPDLRRLLVSGTASIAPDGHTRHVGDVHAQIAWTCEVIAAILQSRRLGWQDVTRATAYVRRPEDRGALEQFRLAQGLPELPVVVAHQPICREDLLFELEVDAVQAGDASTPTRRDGGRG